MTKNIALSRPAMSAIAAFLVLSTPGAFAQDAPTITMTPPVAAPTPQTPPTVPEPSTPAPVTAPETAQPTTAQPTTTQPPAPKPVIRVHTFTRTLFDMQAEKHKDGFTGLRVTPAA